jgi:hypothetical protein
MTIIKKYTAIQLKTETVNDDVNIKLTYGEITGPYYSRNSPDEEFDTEEEAIKYAFKTNKWANWLILPVIKFDNYA